VHIVKNLKGPSLSFYDLRRSDTDDTGALLPTHLLQR
jgi:hypothetical protein